MGSIVNVVTAADTGFVRQLAAMARSLTQAQGPDPFRLFVITDSISGRDREWLSEICEIDWLSALVDRDVGIEIPDHLAPATLWRTHLADLVPASVDRVIYLDADVIVRRSLTPLWNTEIGSNTVGAVQDPLIPWFGAPLGPWRELATAANVSYFNAGVLLIDLEAWRRTDVGTSTLRTLCSTRLALIDQDALNHELKDRWFHLDPAWNVQAAHLDDDHSLAWIVEPRQPLEAAVRDPAIVHFNTSAWFGRPWQLGCSHPLAGEWYLALNETRWAGWIPPVTASTMTLRQRIRRSVSVLVKG